MNLDQILNSMTPEIHSNFKRAIELGKWPNGTALTEQQKETCMEAIISYEQVHLQESERVGYIDRGPKAVGEQCEDGESSLKVNETPIKWA